MKKFLKKSLALLLALCVLCSLCGCTVLDEMRENHGFLQEDGTIIWKENTYQLLPGAEDLYPELDYETDICVTAPDVPLLLCIFYAQDYFTASTDGRFLQSLTGELYCRRDAYDEMIKRLQEGFEPEIYCYFYDVFDEDTWEFSEMHYQLTADEVAAVELVGTTVEPYSANELGRPEAQYSVYLYACSADMLQQQCSTEIIATTVGYSLLVYTQTDVLVFPVPEGLHATFRQMLNAYITAEQFTDMETVT